MTAKKPTKEERKVRRLARKAEFAPVRAAMVAKQSGLYGTQKYKDEKSFLLKYIPELPDFENTMDVVLQKSENSVCKGETFSGFDKASKSTMGSFFETNIKRAFNLPDAEKTHKIDTFLAHVPVDMKYTSHPYGWPIPLSTFEHNQWCLMVEVDFVKRSYSCAIYLPLMEHMGNVPNNDKKWSIASAYRNEVSWIFRHRPLVDANYEDIAIRELALETRELALETRELAVKELELELAKLRNEVFNSL
jgi:hypothetical protein